MAATLEYDGKEAGPVGTFHVDGVRLMLDEPRRIEMTYRTSEGDWQHDSWPLDDLPEWVRRVLAQVEASKASIRLG